MMIHTPTNDNLAYCKAQYEVNLGQVGVIAQFASLWDAKVFVAKNFRVEVVKEFPDKVCYSGMDIVLSISKIEYEPITIDKVHDFLKDGEKHLFPNENDKD